MKHKILPGFLALAVVSAMGMAPATVQAAGIEDVKQNLQGKGIIVAGNVSNLDELKQKLESMGIDCSIPGWLESLCPELPGIGQPGDPDTPDNNQPENPSVPDTDTENASFVRQVVNLVNQERAKAGLSPVTADTSIQAAAQVRAKEIEKSFRLVIRMLLKSVQKKARLYIKSLSELAKYLVSTPLETMKS